jgi:hypothetical protein
MVGVEIAASARLVDLAWSATKSETVRGLLIYEVGELLVHAVYYG